MNLPARGNRDTSTAGPRCPAARPPGAHAAASQEAAVWRETVHHGAGRQQHEHWAEAALHCPQQLSWTINGMTTATTPWPRYAPHPWRSTPSLRNGTHATN